jgi:hypothetical protein
MSKPTVATLKSFIAKNRANLFVQQKSFFSGMHDCVMQNEHVAFVPATATNGYNGHKNTLGINGVWVVGRDAISPFEGEGFKGYSVYNCCGSFVLAVRA